MDDGPLRERIDNCGLLLALGQVESPRGLDDPATALKLGQSIVAVDQVVNVQIDAMWRSREV
jgi:hypothetical protein